MNCPIIWIWIFLAPSSCKKSEICQIMKKKSNYFDAIIITDFSISLRSSYCGYEIESDSNSAVRSEQPFIISDGSEFQLWLISSSRVNIANVFFSMFFETKTFTQCFVILQTLPAMKFFFPQWKHWALDSLKWFICQTDACIHKAVMSEWLRRSTRNRLGFPRAGSNPARSEFF